MKSNLNASFQSTATSSGELSALTQEPSIGLPAKLSEFGVLYDAERYQPKPNATTRQGDSEQRETQHFSTEIGHHAEAPTFTDEEKFSLLSAFLDDEVSDEECCLVNHWLKADPKLKETYQQQLQLRAAFKLFLNE